MRPLTSITAGLAAAAALAAVLLLLPASDDAGAERSAGPLLSAADRAALAVPAPGGPVPAPSGSGATGHADAPGAAQSAGAVGMGPGPPGIAVDPRDPAAVATAYVTLAHSAVAEDAGRPNRRATQWAEPGSVPDRVGVVVLDPPPPGAIRSAHVVSLELVAADPDDNRRLYVADVVETTAGLGTAAGRETTGRDDLLLVRQPDGRWLVRSATPAAPAGADD